MNFIYLKKEEYESLVNSISSLKESILSMGNSTSESTWLPETKAMKFLDVSKSTIQRYRKNGLLPFSQYANKIMYKTVDINAFLEANYSGNSSYSPSISEAA